MRTEKMNENMHTRESRNNIVCEKTRNCKHFCKTFLRNLPFTARLTLMIFIRLNQEEVQYFEYLFIIFSYSLVNTRLIYYC